MPAFTPEQLAKSAETRRRNAALRAEEKLRRQAEAGIPDSKPFGGSPEAENNPILYLHVGGVLVRDMPVEARNRILYQQTDEGILEANEGKVESAARVTMDPLAKQIQHRKDDRLNNVEPWAIEDPLKQVADAHVPPGMRPKFLSTPVVKQRGMRGFEAVKDEHGDPVKVGNLVLGMMPEEKVKARNKFYQDKAARMLSEVTDRYRHEIGPGAKVDGQ